QALGPSAREVVTVLVAGRTLDDLLAGPAVRALAAAGGAAVMPDAGALATADPAADAETAVRDALAGSRADLVLVVVASVVAAPGDPLLPVVVAEGDPATLLDADGPAHALTSDSTRRDGVVTAADVLATVAAFEGGEVVAGHPVRPIDAAPPSELRRRFLERAGSAVPIEVALGLLVTAIGLAAIAALAWPWRAPRGALVALSWCCLGVPGLSLALLLAGHLPRMTVGVVAPTVAALTVLATAAALPAARRDPDRAPGIVGAVAVVALGLEAATGFVGAQLPFLGGSQLDGARFYGLPNAFIGLLVGGALLVAWRLPRATGTTLLFLCGLLAGLPWLGANLGAATTGFAASGLWWVAGRRRADARAAIEVACVLAAGLGVVLLAHAFAPTPTHVQDALRGGGVASRYLDRLAIGLRMLREQPFAIVPALGPVALLLVVLRPPAAIAAGFAASPGSREVVLVAALAGGVAYLANDTGASAAGLTWGLGLVLAFWVSLRAAAARMSG
ncbi:MAG: hypothetical protein ACKO8G_07905, partial [Actinomycetota bacterium]